MWAENNSVVSRLFRRLDETKEHTDFDNEDVIATVGTVLEFGNVNEFGNGLPNSIINHGRYLLCL